MKKKKQVLGLSFRLVGRNKNGQTERERTLLKNQKTVSGKPNEESTSRESDNNVYILLKGEVTPTKCPFV